MRKLKEGGTPLSFCDRLASKGEVSNVSGAKHLAFIPPPMLIVSKTKEMSNKNNGLLKILAMARNSTIGSQTDHVKSFQSW